MQQSIFCLIIAYRSINWYIFSSILSKNLSKMTSIFDFTKNPAFGCFPFRLFTVCGNTLEALINLVCHRDYPCSACCLGILDDILHIPCRLELMIDSDLLFFKINI